MARWHKAAVLLGTVLAVGAGGVAASADEWHTPRTSFQAAAVAVPSAAAPTDVAQARHVDRASGHHTVRVTAAANTALDCDGCAGRAVSLQVVYAGRAHAVLTRNAAVVWADHCQGCTGQAVALQVVLTRSADAVRADNRAFAASTECSGCTVSAVALQFVVVDKRADRLDRRTLTAIEQLAASLTTDTTAPAGSTPSPRTVAGAQRAATAGAAGAAGQDSVAPGPAGAARSTGAEIAGLLRGDLDAPVTMSVRASGG
jgi:hypothetical protein